MVDKVEKWVCLKVLEKNEKNKAKAKITWFINKSHGVIPGHHSYQEEHVGHDPKLDSSILPKSMSWSKIHKNCQPPAQCPNDPSTELPHDAASPLGG